MLLTREVLKTCVHYIMHLILVKKKARRPKLVMVVRGVDSFAVCTCSCCIAKLMLVFFLSSPSHTTSHPNKSGLSSARKLSESLIETVKTEYESFKTSQQTPLGFGSASGYRPPPGNEPSCQ